MKVVAVEGTPDEIARLQELTGFLQATDGGGPPPNGAPSASTPLAQEVAAFIDIRAGAGPRPWIRDFLNQAVMNGEVIASIGRARGAADGLGPYVMVHDKGPRVFGAVAYVRPATGTITFRLPAKSARPPHSYPVLSKTGHPYQVRMRLFSADSVGVGLELLQQALQEVRSKPLRKTQT